MTNKTAKRKPGFIKRLWICVFTGFSSGMPLFVLVQLVPAWLRDQGVDLATIGLFSLIGLPYTWKFVWSPLMDRFQPLPMGRRRGWMILTQCALLISIGLTGSFHPDQSLQGIVILVFLIAFFSASQDIVLDAYRRELLDDDELGTGTSFFTNAYRLSALVPGSLGLILADHIAWSAVFWVVGGFMVTGIITSLLIKDVATENDRPASLRKAIVEPFVEFFSRDGKKHALFILAFVLLYKLGDSMATALATPFYLDLGFSKTEIGTTAKVAALWSSAFGTLVAGLLMIRISINQALWLFGIVQLASIPGYAVLSEVGANQALLFAVVSFEYLGVGLGTVALTAFLARETNRHFTATQFALLSSLTAIPRTFANASTGFIVEAIGYTQFFILCTLIAIPGMILLLKVAPWSGTKSALSASKQANPN